MGRTELDKEREWRVAAENNLLAVRIGIGNAIGMPEASSDLELVRGVEKLCEDLRVSKQRIEELEHQSVRDTEFREELMKALGLTAMPTRESLLEEVKEHIHCAKRTAIPRFSVPVKFNRDGTTVNESMDELAVQFRMVDLMRKVQSLEAQVGKEREQAISMAVPIRLPSSEPGSASMLECKRMGPEELNEYVLQLLRNVSAMRNRLERSEAEKTAALAQQEKEYMQAIQQYRDNIAKLNADTRPALQIHGELDNLKYSARKARKCLRKALRALGEEQ